jgi:hypothetical protein
MHIIIIIIIIIKIIIIIINIITPIVIYQLRQNLVILVSHILCHCGTLLSARLNFSSNTMYSTQLRTT